MLGISSAWCSEICDSGAEIIEEILSLGVSGVELEYRLSRPMLEEIVPLVIRGRISVTSLHNILPLPRKIPKNRADGEFVSLSSPDERERKAAIRYALGTLEWAEGWFDPDEFDPATATKSMWKGLPDWRNME